ncbi:hypothetical protein CDD83_10067 [Cordyceps sp. RAO-2017]|nr:hypothetical protein CDD83_10067 [Cordyceps sp. RAO-2017]
MMDPSKLRPLQALDFKFRPLAPHALAWSCDAELAVALDDAIQVFIPEYAKCKTVERAGADEELRQPQFSISLLASGFFRPEPGINRRLCASAGVELPAAAAGGGDFTFGGAGSGLVTGSGAALGQTVRVEWSPNGLGHNLRPVLAALTTHGAVVVLGEHVDAGAGSSFIASGPAVRSFKNWRLLWGLGALLPVPDAGRRRGFREVDDKIVAFSWAGELLPGRALLAYANDNREVVLVAVQLCAAAAPEGAERREPGWRIKELTRFDGGGPHEVVDPIDPDFMPCGSAFSLKWSPWHVSDESCTATLAYIASNYVGFRRVTVDGAWERGGDPVLRVDQADATAICMCLGADAFVEWEDAVWPDGEGGQIARGIIATPFVPKPFQVDLCGRPGQPMARHSVLQCGTVHPSEDEASTNPITGKHGLLLNGASFFVFFF